jgi:WD40 repeat protein
MKISSLLLVLLVGSASASQEKNLVNTLLTEKKHVFDDLPAEMQFELGSWILRDHPVMIFLLRELSKVSTLLQGHTALVISADFSTSGDKVVTAAADNTAKIWDVSSGRCVQTLMGHADHLNTAQFNDAGDKVVTGSSDKTAKIWNVVRGTCLCTLVGHEAQINSAQFVKGSDDRTARRCEQVLTTSDDKTARLWDSGRGTCLQTFRGHSRGVFSALFIPSPATVVTVSVDQTSKIWGLDGRCLQTVKIPTDPGFFMEFNRLRDKVLRVANDARHGIQIWDASSASCLHTLVGHKTYNVSVAHFNSACDKIVTAGWDKTAKVWDVASGRCLQTLRGHKDGLYSAQFNESGDKVVTASCDRTGRIYNLRRLRELQRFLESEVTHKQALILVGIYETIMCRAQVKKRGADAFENARAVPYDQVKFDFNTYPYLQDEYDRFPDEIKTVLDPYVTKMCISFVNSSWKILREFVLYNE